MKEEKSLYRGYRDLFEKTGNPYYFMLANCYANLADAVVKSERIETKSTEDELTLL